MRNAPLLVWFLTLRAPAGRAGDLTAPAQVTHPFHLPFGPTRDFTERRLNRGDDLLFYGDRRGYVTALPTRWTGFEGEDIFRVVSGAGGRISE